MAIKSKTRWWVALATVLFGVGQADAALLYHIQIDTSSVSGDGVMFFDLSNGDITVDHSVMISNFSIGGGGMLVGSPGLYPSDADMTKNITGTLPGTVSMSDTSALTPPPGIFTYFQSITLGSSANPFEDVINFDFQIFGDMSPPAGQAADGFVFTLLSDPLLSSDPELPGVLFVYNIGQQFTILSESVTFSVEEISVPEPGTSALLLVGLLGLGLARSGRNSPIGKMTA